MELADLDNVLWFRPSRSLVITVCICFFSVPIQLSGQQPETTTPVGTELTSARTLAWVELRTWTLQEIALSSFQGANRDDKFGAGTSPFGIAFDGANMWIADSAPTKSPSWLQRWLHTGSFSVGSGPATLTFDGANIGVAMPMATT